MIIQALDGQTAHRSIKSEDFRAPRSSAESATSYENTTSPRRTSSAERVASYRKRGSAHAAAQGSEFAALVSPQPTSAAAASFGTKSITEVVIGDDDRTVVPDPTASPWRHVCALRIQSTSGRDYVGTGWFIGPTTLMTAGHCVYLHNDGGWPAAITVIPALSGNVEPYGEIVSRRFRATQGWVDTQDTNVDYGAIQLDSPAGDAAGWFSFTAYDDEVLQNNDANIAGYPFDLDHATRMYFHSRRVMSLSPHKLFYDIDTYGGQSGSPVWFTVGTDRIAVGIHTTGSSTSNSGTRITPDVFQNMTSWREERLPAGATRGAGARVPDLGIGIPASTAVVGRA